MMHRQKRPSTAAVGVNIRGDTMARIRRANRNSNMMVTRANEISAFTISAGEGNAEFAKAYVCATEDGDTPLTSCEAGETVYLICISETEDDVANALDAESTNVASATLGNPQSFEMPASAITVTVESGK